MTVDNRSQDNRSGAKGLDNKVQQNRGVNLKRNSSQDSQKGIGKPVDNGGAVMSKYDVHLEKQWLAVRDDYLANFPELKDMDTTYDKTNFNTLMANLAKRRKQTTEQIQGEIMNWPASK